jgi:hypothetical protein
MAKSPRTTGSRSRSSRSRRRVSEAASAADNQVAQTQAEPTQISESAAREAQIALDATERATDALFAQIQNLFVQPTRDISLMAFHAGYWTASLPVVTIISQRQGGNGSDVQDRLLALLGNLGEQTATGLPVPIKKFSRLCTWLTAKNRRQTSEFLFDNQFRDYFRAVYEWLKHLPKPDDKWGQLGIELGLLEVVSWLVFESEHQLQSRHQGHSEQPGQFRIGPSELKGCFLRTLASQAAAKPSKKPDPSTALRPVYEINIARLVQVAGQIPPERLRVFPCLTILCKPCPPSEAAHIRRVGEAVGSANYCPKWGRQQTAIWAMQYFARLADQIAEQLRRPFVPDALLSEVNDLPEATRPISLQYLGIAFDQTRHTVWDSLEDGEPLRLGPVEFALVKHLAEAEGELVSRQSLQKCREAAGHGGQTRNIGPTMNKLRKKFQPTNFEIPKGDQRKKGYRLIRKAGQR